MKSVTSQEAYFAVYCVEKSIIMLGFGLTYRAQWRVQKHLPGPRAWVVKAVNIFPEIGLHPIERGGIHHITFVSFPS